jgi:DNA-binding protein H-NS
MCEWMKRRTVKMARSPIDVSNIDFESLSDGQIRDLIKHAGDTLRDRFTSKLDEFRMLADEAGYEIVKRGETTDRKWRKRATDTGDADDRRGVVLPKFQNPDHPSEQWSGRGRKPKWVEEILASGKKLDDLLIHRAPAEPAAAAD